MKGVRVKVEGDLGAALREAISRRGEVEPDSVVIISPEPIEKEDDADATY